MILHILRQREWEEALRLGAYQPPSLDSEGFIHCSTVTQLVDTANIFFHGAHDVLLLCIDESKVAATVTYRNPRGYRRCPPAHVVPPYLRTLEP